jgi:hypothetical protein
MTWIVAVIGKPLGALVMFGIARALVYPLRRWMPDCAVKRFLLFSWRV